MRLLVAIGLLLWLRFAWWFGHSNPVGYAPLFWALTLSLGFKLLHVLYEWYHYVSVREPVVPRVLPQLQVDVLTTACPGEPLAMIERTLRAMQAIEYPHTSYLCDEGDNAYLKALCRELGIEHVTRTNKADAKAGNINNALRQATGDICVVLDPDHVPTPDFLHHVLPYFADSTVGFVQVVQAYGNQQESLVARGAAEQTYHFYGPLMMGMNAYGTVQAIGANCTFRRAALDSIGGHAAGLTEDMHTAMRLHAAGWQSVYVPRILSKGLVPATLAAYYSQQLKWSRGAFDLLLRVYPRLFASFTWRQRLHYLLLPLYFLSGLVTLVDLAIPVISLLIYQAPWHIPFREFLLYGVPPAAMILLIRHYAQQWLRAPDEAGLHLVGGFLRIGTWWVYLLGFIYALLGVKVPYLPTPKEGHFVNEWKLSLPNLLAAGVCGLAAVQGIRLAPTSYVKFMALLSLLNAGILLTSVLMGQHVVLRQLVRDLASRPLRGLTLAVERTVSFLTQRLRSPVRQVALGGALLLTAGTVPIDLLVANRHELQERKQAESWLHNGGHTTHAGIAVSIRNFNRTMATVPMGEPGLSSTPDKPEIVGIDIDPNSGAGLPLNLIRSLHRRHVTALLSWPTSARDSLRWPLIARQLQNLSGPVMIRPLLESSSATEHRRMWQQLVATLNPPTTGRKPGPNIIWVWTAPQPNQLSEWFPGARYVDWIAADYAHHDLTTEPGEMAATEAYEQLRLQIAPMLDLHQKPIMLITGPSNQADLARQHFHEVKVIIRHLPKHSDIARFAHPESPKQRGMSVSQKVH